MKNEHKGRLRNLEVKAYDHAIHHLDLLEDGVGREGLCRLADLLEKQAYEAEAAVHAEWFRASGGNFLHNDSPDLDAEVGRMVRAYERISKRIRQEADAASRSEGNGLPSLIQGLRDKRRKAAGADLTNAGLEPARKRANSLAREMLLEDHEKELRKKEVLELVDEKLIQEKLRAPNARTLWEWLKPVREEFGYLSSPGRPRKI